MPRKGNGLLLFDPCTRADCGDITPPRARTVRHHPPSPNNHNGLYDHHLRGGGSASAVKKYADPTASIGCASTRNSLHQHRQRRTACQPQVGSQQGGRNPRAALEITPPPEQEVTSTNAPPHLRFTSPPSTTNAAESPTGSNKLKPRPRGTASRVPCRSKSRPGSRRLGR